MEDDQAPPANVQVAIRIRPLLEREKNDGHEINLLEFDSEREIAYD